GGGERSLGRACAHAGRAAWLRRRGDRIECVFRRRFGDAGRRRDNGSIDHVQSAVNGGRSEASAENASTPASGAGVLQSTKNLQRCVRAVIGSGRLSRAAPPEGPPP